MSRPWIWPHTEQPVWPDEPGQFGTARRHDIHTGVDLYCPHGAGVLAVEAGRVVHVEDFTGPNAVEPSPWWNDTQAILIEGASGVVVYGELAARIMVGDHVQPGDLIGIVDRAVLRNFKQRPMVMLHMELMAPGSRNTLWWRLNESRPSGLLDPTPFLKEAAGKSLQQFVLSEWDHTRFLPPEM